MNRHKSIYKLINLIILVGLNLTKMEVQNIQLNARLGSHWPAFNLICLRVMVIEETD